MKTLPAIHIPIAMTALQTIPAALIVPDLRTLPTRPHGPTRPSVTISIAPPPSCTSAVYDPVEAALATIHKLSAAANVLCILRTQEVYMVYYGDSAGYHIILTPLQPVSTLPPYHIINFAQKAILADVISDIQLALGRGHAFVIYMHASAAASMHA